MMFWDWLRECLYQEAVRTAPDEKVIRERVRAALQARQEE